MTNYDSFQICLISNVPLIFGHDFIQLLEKTREVINFTTSWKFEWKFNYPHLVVHAKAIATYRQNNLQNDLLLYYYFVWGFNYSIGNKFVSPKTFIAVSIPTQIFCRASSMLVPHSYHSQPWDAKQTRVYKPCRPGLQEAGWQQSIQDSNIGLCFDTSC